MQGGYEERLAFKASIDYVVTDNERKAVTAMSTELLLTLASAAVGGAVTYTVFRNLPNRESPKPDLDQVEKFIESAPRAPTNGLLTD